MYVVDLCTNQFFHGAVMMASAVAALFFLKFWRKTGDRFFAYFAAAFFLLGVERWFLLITREPIEARSAIYVFRLLAFVLIIWAVIAKNGRKTAD